MNEKKPMIDLTNIYLNLYTAQVFNWLEISFSIWNSESAPQVSVADRQQLYLLHHCNPRYFLSPGVNKHWSLVLKQA